MTSIGLPVETLLHVFSFCHEDHPIKSVQWNPFIKNENQGPSPQILATLSLVCREWNDLASQEFLWKMIVKTHELPIDLADTYLKTKRKVEEFVKVFLKLKDYKRFKKIACGKNSFPHPLLLFPSSIIPESALPDECFYPSRKNRYQSFVKDYKEAKHTSLFLKALRRFRALYPCTQGLNAPLLVPLMNQEGFKGIYFGEIIHDIDNNFSIFFPGAEAFEESRGYIRPEPSSLPPARVLVHISQQSFMKIDIRTKKSISEIKLNIANKRKDTKNLTS